MASHIGTQNQLLMILEFIPPVTELNDYTMPVLSNFVGSLSPVGSEFFAGYILGQPHWILHVDIFCDSIIEAFVLTITC